MSEPVDSRRPLRHAALAALAVGVCVASLTLPRLGAQGSVDTLYVDNQDTLYAIDPNTATSTVVNPLSGTPCYPGAGGAMTYAVDSAPDGTLYGFARDCAGAVYSARLNPTTAVLTLLNPVPAYLMTVGDALALYFRPSFLRNPAPGGPLGYHATWGPNAGHLGGPPLNVYAVDSLDPYSEHLVSTNNGPGRGNFGLGTVVALDGSALNIVTQDAVYELLLPTASNILATQVGFLSVHRISRNASVTGFASNGTTFYIVDGSNLYAYDANSVTTQVVPS